MWNTNLIIITLIDDCDLYVQYIQQNINQTFNNLSQYIIIPNKTTNRKQMQRNLSPFILLIVLSLIPLHSSTSYLTNPNRTATVTSLCASFPDRTQLVSSTGAADVEQYNLAMKASFTVTGNQLFSTIIKTRDPNSVLTNYPQLPQEYGLFVGPFVVCLFIMCFTCLCTCCCCCCPATCPPCSCCRKPMGQSYSKCQLIWPAIVLILALGLILAAGAIGLSKSKDVQTTIQSVGCSVSIALDDIINGNVTTGGNFFIGIKTLSNQIAAIKSSLATIETQFTSLVNPTGSAYMGIMADYTPLEQALDEMPSGTRGSRHGGITYNSPFISPTTTISSSFPTDLGSTNIADAASPIYQAHTSITTTQSIINQITTSATSVSSTITSGTFTTALDSAKTAINEVSKVLESGDKNFYTIYSGVTPYLGTVTTAATGIYGGLIGIASLGILATILLAFCNFYKCRFLLYFTCCILLIVGIVSLLLATIISALIPIFYFTCDFTTYSFSSATNFNNNFGSLIPTNVSSMVVNCLPGQSGDFLQSSALGSAATSLTNLRSSLSGLNSFDPVAINSQIDSFWNPAKNMVQDTYSGKRLDFNSPGDVTILETISTPSNYACGVASFAQDSWLPTNQPSGAISCKSGSTIATCTAGNFPTIAAPCTGCMDTHQFLKNFMGSLTSRYPGCTTFTNDLSSVYTNFYGRKQLAFTNSASPPNVLTRTAAADTLVSNYKNQIISLGATFTSISTTLASTVNSITDPTYGVVAGLNCAIVGQDILLVNNAACVNGFQLLFFVRAAFGIAGFGVLFTMYCASCTGARHFKQSQVKSKTIDQRKDLNQTNQDLKVKNNSAETAKNNIIRQNNYMQKDYATNYQGNQSHNYIQPQQLQPNYY